MSVLAVAIAFLGANLGDSGERSVADFMNNSHMPGALITTELLPLQTAREMESSPEIAAVYPRLVYDTHIRLAGGELYSVRLFSWDEGCPMRQTEHASAPVPDGVPAALIAREFAVKAGIGAGDILSVVSPAGFTPVGISAQVSNPETLACVYDGMSAYESGSFTYIYLSSGDMETLTGLGGLANQWLVYFADGMGEKEEKAALERAWDVTGDAFLSSEYMADSDALRSIYDDVDTIRVLCGFIPPLIWLISLGFSFIFIRIIIINRQGMIGLLRALGFSTARVTGLFASYAGLTGLVSLLPGIPLGMLLRRLGTGALCSAVGILEPVIVTDVPVTLLMLLITLLTGVLAAVLSAGAVARMDPAEALSGRKTDTFEPPALIRRLRTSVFFKLSLTAVLRSLLRQCVGALCVAACVIIMCIGFEGIYTIGYPIDAVYGGRFAYDMMVRGLSDGSCERIAAEVDGLDRVEPAEMFTADLLGENVRVSTVAEDSRLIRLQDDRGNSLLPGNGVIIDEMRARMNGLNEGDTVLLNGMPLKITGIAREILYCVQYISPETARAMGRGQANCALIALSPGADENEVRSAILEIDSGAYFAFFDAQREDIRGGFSGMRLVMGIFAALGFGIGSMLMLNMSVIDFHSDRKRFAILRALGVSAGKLIPVPLAENMFRVLAGILIAVPACGLCTAALLKALSNATQQYVFVRYGECLLLSCLIPCLYVLMNVIMVWVRIRRLRYMEELNEVE